MTKDELISISKEDYFLLVHDAKQKIASGTCQDLREAEEILDHLEKWRPMRLAYICARVELMLAQGKDKIICRHILDGSATEKYPQPELAEVFRVKQLTFPPHSMEWNMCEYTRHLYQGEKRKYKEYTNRLERSRAQALLKKTNISSDELKELAELYYITRDMTMYFVLMMAWCSLNDHLADYEQYIAEPAGSRLPILNLGYLARQFQDDIRHVFVLIDHMEKKNSDLDVLALALRLLGQEVVLLRGIMTAEEPLSTRQAVASSVDAVQTADGIITMTPMHYRTQSGGDWKTNTEELLLFIADSVEQKGALIFFTDDRRMETLPKNHEIAKHVQRLSDTQPEQFSNHMAFGWAGDYLKYMSFIYGFDMQERVNRPAECEFSIVIPVRNNPEPLKYTLHTCLQLDFEGEYEVVISDNSDPGDTAIEDLCHELNDSKLRYYRTPFVLDLPKSFEFAYMQTRGAFIFSMGADDGIFPWALKVIKTLLNNMGDCEIMQWNRGFYCWPGFNYGQQNQLIMPYPELPSPIPHTFVSGRELLISATENAENGIFNFPLLYINSGFKKSYFHTLLEQTGRLWDTPSQDVPMGTINIALQSHFLYTEFPLTIAGATPKSIGYQSNLAHDSLKDLADRAIRKRIPSMMGEYGYCREEHRVPFLPIHDFLFYCSLCKLHVLGIVSEEAISAVNWQHLFARYVKRVSKQEAAFESYMGEIRYSARLFDNEFGQWLENLYEEQTSPLPAEAMAPSTERIYSVGIDGKRRAICIDGSDFGITNIEEAIHFTSKLLNLR